MEVACDVEVPAEQDRLFCFGLFGVRDELVGFVNDLRSGKTLFDEFRQAGVPSLGAGMSIGCKLQPQLGLLPQGGLEPEDAAVPGVVGGGQFASVQFHA